MAIEGTPQPPKHPLSGTSKMYPKHHTALFELDGFDVPQKVHEIGKKNGLIEKEEHHLTLVGFRVGSQIKKILSALEPQERDRKLAAYTDLVASFAASPQADLDTLYLISKTYEHQPGPDGGALPAHTRRALVAPVEMPEMEDFYASLNQIFESDFEPTFPHVSLYTGSDHKPLERLGIGIYSQKEFEEMGKKKVA